MIVVALLLLTVWLERALHLADHASAAAVDAIAVAVEAAIVAAVLAFEALAAIMSFGAVETLEALWPFEAFGPFGAFLGSLGLTIRAALGTAIEAFSAIVSAVVSTFDALKSFRAVVSDDAFVTLCALEPFGAVDAIGALCTICTLRTVDAIRTLRTVDAIRTLGSVGSFNTRRPFGAFWPLVALGPVGELASLRRRFNSVGPFATIIAIVDLIDASGVDAHSCVVWIGGGYCASTAARAWANAARRLRV